ncbi:DUF397 domain-containing protein, partial [Actinomadura welshii]
MDTSGIKWRISSYSTGNGGQCVEVGAWHKSSHSADEGECIEVAASQAAVLTRDSKDPDGPVLGFEANAWDTFLNTVKGGRLDLR